MRKKQLLTYIVVAALAFSQPTAAFADATLSLVGPAGQGSTNQSQNQSNQPNQSQNQNSGNPSENKQNTSDVPMAGTGTPEGMGSSNAGGNQGSPNAGNSNSGNPNTGNSNAENPNSGNSNSGSPNSGNSSSNTGSNSSQVPGAGNPGENEIHSGMQNPGTGSTGAYPSQKPGDQNTDFGSGTNATPGGNLGNSTTPGGNAGNSTGPSGNSGNGSGPSGAHSSESPVRDGMTPETALLYVTKATQSESTGTNVSKPTVQAEGAYLYNATTGETLFEKNANKTFYPASITKLMTALLVLENCRLDDVVTYHSPAVDNLESGAVKLGLTEGDTLTVKDSLYAILLKSANDVAAGLAEHVAGSQEAFAKMMNDRAATIGCTNTHFTNPHGLNDQNHYTTPHDMALIAAEAFKNPTLCEINSTLSYVIPATKKVNTARTVVLGHKMFYKNDSRYYDGIIGGKTGYTSKAGNTLVSGVDRDGVRLIAVVLKSSQSHYQDTKAMLDYGFQAIKQQNSGKEEALLGTWKQNEYGWYFLNESNHFVKNIWMNIDGQVYLFDADGYMVTGWKKVNNSDWYYFGSSGSMKKGGWIQTNENWYYVREDGRLLTNGVTPDGYKVDEFGIWKQS